ncbi:hypothetical protein RB653_001301 [Dictyostelium firmibasis]|uniref:Uncharacterized protein n=1 Tax=Dictyostelium firmibasis TaxID=79012 RepID=A0AAN7Z1Z2_9MYCE
MLSIQISSLQPIRMLHPQLVLMISLLLTYF